MKKGTNYDAAIDVYRVGFDMNICFSVIINLIAFCMFLVFEESLSKWNMS